MTRTTCRSIRAPASAAQAQRDILGALPGVQADGDSSGISLQGALPYQVDVTVDGVTVKNASGGTFIGDSFPSTESISEIRADGVLANAEFGDPGQIIVTTKGGAQQAARFRLLVLPGLRSWTPSLIRIPTTTTKPDVTRQHVRRQRGRPGGDSPPL